MTIFVGRAARTCLTALLCASVACGGSERRPAASPSSNPAALREGSAYRPDIRASDFVRTIDNELFPLAPGTTFRYEGVAEGKREVDVMRVTDRNKSILGVRTVVVHDSVYSDGHLAEDTLDWYAQDSAGNVWYFGEDTKELDARGRVTGREGSWTAGVDGAQPGIVMLASPASDDVYRQEYLRGHAEDTARVLSTDSTVKVRYGSFDHVLVTEERTRLEPDLVERKYYAPGVGFVFEEVVKGGHETSELVDVSPGREVRR